MREADFQRRMALEHAAEHETRGGDGGVERIADQVAEIVGRQPIRPRHVDGVEQNERIELGGRGPDRLELGIVEVLARHVRADLRAAQARARAWHDEARPRRVSAPAWAASRWRESGRDEPWPAWRAARSECGRTPPPAPEVAHRRRSAGKPRAPEHRPWMPPCPAGGAPNPSRRAGNAGRRCRRRRGWRSWSSTSESFGATLGASLCNSRMVSSVRM